MDETETAGRIGDAGLQTAALAAATLEGACRGYSASPDEERLGLYLQSVGELAGDIRRDLSSLSQRPEVTAEALVSAALRGADLATLAACALPELPPDSPVYLRVEASARLASAATRSLVLEHGALELEVASRGYESRDLRGAEWRADLAARQIEDMTRGES